MRITNNSGERKRQPEFKAAEVYLEKESLNFLRDLNGFKETLNANAKLFKSLAHKNQDISIHIKHCEGHNDRDFSIIATVLNNDIRVNSKVLNADGEYISSSMQNNNGLIGIDSFAVDKNLMNKNDKELGKKVAENLVEKIKKTVKKITNIGSFSKPWLKEIENPDSFEQII